MAKPPSPPLPQQIRLTISVTPETHAVYSRMAEASGMSLGRCMGEWLADTAEGAEFVIDKLERARRAPREVIKEMRQGMLGLIDESDQLLSDLRSGALQIGETTTGRRQPAAGGAAGGGRAAAPPRSVIRGGKSPGKTRSGPRAEGDGSDE